MNESILADWYRRVLNSVHRCDTGVISTIGFIRELDALHQESVTIRTKAQPPSEPPAKDNPAGRTLAAWARTRAVYDFVIAKKLTINRKTQWRWIDSDECTGMINALPTCRGIPRITDGIIVWIEKGDGTCFPGHIDWFDKDKREGTKNSRKAKEEIVPALAEYIHLI